jgi:glycosyltransferase involved in cell wall biosynthesis
MLHVPNGTDIRQRRSGPNLARLGLHPYGYVLFLVRLSPEENCGLLIEAFEDTETPLKLVLAGGSSHTDAYAASLRDHASDRIRSSTRFPGMLRKKCSLTQLCLFCLPT